MKKVSFLIIFIIAVNVNAMNFGKSGQTYEISEIDFLYAIEQRAKETNWEALFEKEKSRLRELGFVNFSLPQATEHKTRFLDLTTSLDHSIQYRDKKSGTIKTLYPKGFRFNVLAHIQSNEKFVVINGERPEEVSWFLENYGSSLSVYPLVSTGDVITLTEKHNKLFSKLTSQVINKFNIKVTPTIFYQEGLFLRIDEIPINIGELK